LVVGLIFVFLGASTTFGVNASCINPQLPRVVQHYVQAIQEQVVGQPCQVGNVKVSPGTGNDYHPRMTMNAAGDIIIVYEQEEDVTIKTIPVIYSADEGDTWKQQFLFNSLAFQGSGLLGYPDIIYNPSQDLLWCVAFDPLAEMYNQEMYFIPGDIATTSEILGYAISGSTMNYWYGACAHTNDYFLVFNTEDYGGDMTRILGLTWMVYPDFSYPPGLGGFYYDGQSLLRISPLAELEADCNAN